MDWSAVTLEVGLLVLAFLVLAHLIDLRFRSDLAPGKLLGALDLTTAELEQHLLVLERSDVVLVALVLVFDLGLDIRHLRGTLRTKQLAIEAGIAVP